MTNNGLLYPSLGAHGLLGKHLAEGMNEESGKELR